MKKILFSLFLITTFAITSHAQKIAYIETDKILENMTEFSVANEQIEASVKEWESQIDTYFKNVEDLYNKYVQQQAQYSEDMKQMKQDEIIEAENEANEFKNQIFGEEGQLSVMQEEKIKPIVDKVFVAAREVAKANNYDYVFEYQEESNWIYLNPAFNLTELVKIELGL